MNTGIYSISYKNLRRNWFRNTSTVLRIGFGVLIFVILVSSGLGISTFLGQNQAAAGSSILNQSGSNGNTTNLLNTVNDFINSRLGIDISKSQFLGLVETILKNIINFFDLMASIVFLIGIFGITNAMTVNLLERKREIGLLKSLGFTENQIILSHLLEAGLLGFIGALIGIVVGIFGIIILSSVIKVIHISILIPWWLPVTALLLTTCLSMLLAAYTVFYYTRQNAVEALRYE
ncbi:MULTISPECIES: ABC transporter permease [Methanobacterium]|jgi:putative ABC transport system permease protein|uniref:FtsX-like permease family protein n=1 Tax=Methanobacterium veterum TaxID=408577 RepID=A0A9E5A5H8_9EURY|nr:MULTISPECIES: FtsX-like permease family protein [Methanobacterium]MCZ3373895.1 FtsX-like permease family protein [Methanobacterium veterum]